VIALLPEKEGLAIVKLTQKALDKKSREIHMLRSSEKKEDEVVVKLLRSKNPAKNSVVCPRCGKEAVFLRTLNKYYCFHCKKYV